MNPPPSLDGGMHNEIAYLIHEVYAMKRTTIFADEKLLVALHDIAKKEHVSLSAVIRTALEEYVDRRQATGPLPSFLGIGGSGRKDVAERAEELLWTSPRSGRKR